MRKGKFDLDDMADQLAQMEKIGGLGRHHGHATRHRQDEGPDRRAGLDDKMIKRQRAIISVDDLRRRRRQLGRMLKRAANKNVSPPAPAPTRQNPTSFRQNASTTRLKRSGKRWARQEGKGGNLMRGMRWANSAKKMRLNARVFPEA